MKHIVFTTIWFMITLDSFSQKTIEGWYYLPNPAGNIWGIGYRPPIEGEALSYAGNLLKQVKEEDLLVQSGPKTSEQFISNLNNLVLLSLFNNNKSIAYSIYSSHPKQVLLRSEIFKTFDDGNYYVTQGLKADSVVIKGKINKDVNGNSKDAENIISKLSAANTAAFKITSALSGKDTTATTGKISYKKEAHDSFTIIITDPDVYFAVKLTRVAYKGDPTKKVDIYKQGDNISNISEEATDLFYYHYQVNKGLDVGIRFYVKDSIATAEVYEHYAGKKEGYNILTTKSKKITANSIPFKIEGSTFTPNSSTKRNKSKDFLITAESSFVYNPSTNSVTLDGLDGNILNTNTVYHVEGTYSTWPK